MKYQTITALCATLILPTSAQTPVAPPVIVDKTVEIVPGGSPEVQEAKRRLDAALARERLGIAPIALPKPEPAAVVETTTTTIEEPGQPTRVYRTDHNVVIVDGRELPYLTLPVLFVEGSDKLLDTESALAIEDTAAAIKDVLAANPTAIFDVEGHTSTDGAEEMNMKLSADRARRVYSELLARGVPTHALAAHGYGENFPQYPDGSEEQMILDRRVLVVRVK